MTAICTKQLYWRHADQLPPEYRSRECRNGGDLDLAPGDNAWPYAQTVTELALALD
jgi:hypothetical protein